MKQLFLATTFFAGIFFMAHKSSAQMSGNQVYKNSYSSRDYSTYQKTGDVIINDSTMLIAADILFNGKADELVVTLGLNEEAKTVKETNALINRRLSAFKVSLSAIGISEKDIYVDYVSQTKVYDYTVKDNTASQFLKGFEIKKNIIIRLVNPGNFDKLADLASEQQIYDVVKIDYVINDIQKIYTEMMSAAAGIIRQKKDTYLQLSPVELLPVPLIRAETFYTVFPNTQYKEYQAFETSDVTVNYNNSNFVKNEARKNKTFYYDKINQSGFDQVINNSSPVVGIQQVLQIKMQYKISKK